MSVRRLNHAVLYVSGLDREVEFYKSTLGFEVRATYGGKAAFLGAPGSLNDHDLGLFEIGSSPAAAVGPGQSSAASGQPEVGLYHLAWEVGTLADLVDIRARLVKAGALVGESDHRVSKSLYAKDPCGIEFEVMWRVPAEDWDAEMAKGGMTVPLDWDATLEQWGADRVTGAAAGSAT
jgi:catechol-2,3-dioxygenase